MVTDSRLGISHPPVPKYRQTLACKALSGQGLFIRFIRTLAAHRTAIIKAMTRSPLMDGSTTARRAQFIDEAPQICAVLWDASLSDFFPQESLSSGATPRVQVETM